MAPRLPPKIKKLLGELPPENRHHFLATVSEYISTGNPSVLLKWSRIPVSPRFFIRDPYFMGALSTVTGQIDEHGKPEYRQTIVSPLYPEVLKHFEEICSHTSPYLPREDEPDFPVIDELLATGGIGAGKSTLALYVMAYHLYLLSCMVNPQQYYNLDPASEILIVFQAPTGDIAETGDYARFRNMIGSSRYFQENFFPQGVQIAPGKNPLGKTTLLEFPNRVVVKAISSLETGAIGQNVFSALIEEVNFMGQRTQKDGARTDHAAVLYEALATRRKTRLTRKATLLTPKGPPRILSYVPGVICMVSSRVYPGQFTDTKESEAKVQKNIYVYDKRVWEVKPEDYIGETFRVFAGDETRKPRVLDPQEVVPESDIHLVDTVPVEYRASFDGPRGDIVTALRNVCGRSVLATFPLMPNRELVAQNFGKRTNLVTLDALDFVLTKPAVIPSLLGRNPHCPRWCHIDLALTQDSAGLVIGHVPGFKAVHLDPDPALKFKTPTMEKLPIVEVDLVLEIRPPHKAEIDFGKIRALLYKLREHGLPLKWVSLDNFQSRDMMQTLRQTGFAVGYQSMDTTQEPYKLLKQSLYDGRMVLPKHPKLLKELLQLERDTKKNKIDHPPTGCHVGCTRVQLADGTSRTMEQLVEDYANGITHTGLTFSDSLQPALLLHPRVTKEVTELVEIELDNGEKLWCTPEHPYLLTSGEYKQAQHLTPEDELQT